MFGVGFICGMMNNRFLQKRNVRPIDGVYMSVIIFWIIYTFWCYSFLFEMCFLVSLSALVMFPGLIYLS